MRIHIPCTALGLALAVVAPAAHAQTKTVVTRQIVSQPVETVRTVTTTRIVHPIVRRKIVVTRHTTVGERGAPLPPLAPAPAAVATTYPRPVYDAVAPAPLPPPYPRPVYDVVAPAPPAPVPAVAEPIADETVVAPGAPVPPFAAGTDMPAYRYVYEPDRILVIDPATGIAVQALPR